MPSPSLLTTLLILLSGLAIARLMAGRLARWAVPAIVVELAIGCLLGNTVLPFQAIQPLSGLTELGVLSLFFQVGLEVRADLLASRGATIARLVGLSALAPLLGYWPLVQVFAMPPATALLCLACVSATGTGVTLRLLAQRRALHTPSGRLLVGVSVLDDLPAIALLSLAVALGGGNGLGGSVGGWQPMLLGLAAAALSYGLAGWWRHSGQAAPSSPLAILMLLIGSAWLGEVSGLTSLLGALWGGVLLNRLSPEPPRVGGLLMVVSEVFLPLYFIGVGMRLQAGSLLQSQAWGLALLLLLLAFGSKLLCGLGVSAADRRTGIDRWLVVLGLMPRGLPGLVFATTALAAGVINAVQFSALVLMVTVTTAVGLLLLERRLQQQQKTPGWDTGG
jgi:Kef-type K+ transport system membrane component KefB